MRKSTLFISAMLTMFLMATMFGVASAYQTVVKNGGMSVFNSQPPKQVASQSVDGQLVNVPVASSEPQVVSPDQATNIAVDFLGDPGVYSVEVVNYEGASAYLVTFSSGDLVYVSSTGVVLTNNKVQPVVVVAASNVGAGAGSGTSGSNQGSNSGNSGGDESSEHEGGEHDEHDD
ncbi:MAG: hypothetical protein IPG80_07770 [Anaerolineales bacterium]|uniref:hypothetical protein n=1 Tax=Candidatus Villigracilis vicinus TaxID=3140679 RepID=UPI00313518C1|nr:hypothetical protein [Anaerolineales bacterium]MBK9780069.1 hypothetical protein [Anaerolineales bacterium]